ncbi:MAG: hypothetical protein RR147_06460 [Oscillospiraceae bacterium]
MKTKTHPLAIFSIIVGIIICTASIAAYFLIGKRLRSNVEEQDQEQEQDLDFDFELDQ